MAVRTSVRNGAIRAARGLKHVVRRKADKSQRTV